MSERVDADGQVLGGLGGPVGVRCQEAGLARVVGSRPELIVAGGRLPPSAPVQQVVIGGAGVAGAVGAARLRPSALTPSAAIRATG